MTSTRRSADARQLHNPGWTHAMKPILTLLLAAAVMTAPCAVQAQGAGASANVGTSKSMSEHDVLAARLMRIVLDLQGIDLVKGVIAGASSAGGFMKVAARPQWDGFFTQAVADEVRADEAQVDALMGKATFAAFSTAEIQAGIAFLSSPGGRVLATLPSSETTRSPAAESAMKTLLGTSAGRGFNTKFSSLDSRGSDAASREIIALIMPGVFDRLSQAIRADETTRSLSPLTPKEELGTRLAHIMIQQLDSRQGYLKRLSGSDAFDSNPMYPSGWTALWDQAVADRFDIVFVELEQLQGRKVASQLSIEELTAGVTFLESPEGGRYLASLVDERKGKQAAELSDQDKSAVAKFANSKTGQAFLKKMGEADQSLDDEAAAHFMAVFLIETFPRFAELARAERTAATSAPAA